MQGDDEGAIAAPIRRTKVCSHSNASCHSHGHMKERSNAESRHQGQRGPGGSSGSQIHAHSHPPAFEVRVAGSYGEAVTCVERERPLTSQDALAGSTLRAVPVHTPQFSKRRGDRSYDSAHPHPPKKTVKSPFQSAALLDTRGALHADASASPAKARLAGSHRVSSRSQGEDRACKQPPASLQLTRSNVHPQRVLPSRMLRAAASLALLLALQVWQVAVACWWQSVREALCVGGEGCRRFSFGLQVAAAGLLRRVPDAKGWRAAALSSCVRLLQVPGELLRRVAARAAEASSNAAAATQAARVTALGTAQAVGCKWSLISRGGRAAARQAASEAPLSFPPPAETPSLQLTPEEALATGKQMEAHLTRWWSSQEKRLSTCDLWASIHRECPSQHVGVLQFQELLRKHLTAKDGALHLLLANLEDERQPTCESHEASARVSCPQDHSVACGHQKAPWVQPDKSDPHQGKRGALRRTAQSMVYACRLALVSWGVLFSLLALPFQQPASQQSKSRTMLEEPLGRSWLSKLTKQSMVFAEVISKELRMECGVALAATKRLLKFARRSISWAPTKAAGLAAAAVSVGIPWEGFCATPGWARAARAARHARSGTAAAASLPLNP